MSLVCPASICWARSMVTIERKMPPTVIMMINAAAPSHSGPKIILIASGDMAANPAKLGMAVMPCISTELR